MLVSNFWGASENHSWTIHCSYNSEINILCTLFLQLYMQMPVMSNIWQVTAAGMQVDVHIMSHALLQGLSKVSYKSLTFLSYIDSVCVPHCPTLELNFKPMIIFWNHQYNAVPFCHHVGNCGRKTQLYVLLDLAEKTCFTWFIHLTTKDTIHADCQVVVNQIRTMLSYIVVYC